MKYFVLFPLAFILASFSSHSYGSLPGEGRKRVVFCTMSDSPLAAALREGKIGKLPIVDAYRHVPIGTRITDIQRGEGESPEAGHYVIEVISLRTDPPRTSIGYFPESLRDGVRLNQLRAVGSFTGVLGRDGKRHQFMTCEAILSPLTR